MNVSRSKIFIITLLFILPLAGYLTAEKYFNRPSLENTRPSYELLGSVLQVPLLDNKTQADTNQPEEPLSKTLVLSPENILWYVNQNRINYGLQPVQLHTALNTSARLKNSDMLMYDYFEHSNPITHTSFDVFFDKSNYSFIRIAENLAMGNFITSKEVVDAWMNSPHHRKNILDPDFRDMGIDITEGVIHNTSTKLITQHFGNPRTSCPQIDSNLKKDIDSLNIVTQSLLNQIQIKKQQIGEYDTLPDDKISFDAYNQTIEDHNELVKKYNNYADQLKSLVDQYNTIIKTIDRCIQGKG